jgi:predicted RNA binding protein YcfA (HicA-like mRNA interferase family)
MKLPRNLTGRQLAAALHRLGYAEVGQTGSHIKLRTERDGRRSITIPDHAPLKVGTLSRILQDVAKHHDMTRNALLSLLFDTGPKS